MKIQFILGFILFSFQSFAQSKNTIVEDSVSTVSEILPEFPGGPSMMYEYFSKNINWPTIDFTQEIKTKTYVEFDVDKKGKIKNVKIIKSIHSAIDAEVIRVVKEMPKWSPGTKQGKPVDMKYTIPFNVYYG